MQAIEPLSACANERWRVWSYVSARRRSRMGSDVASRWTVSDAGSADPSSATTTVTELMVGCSKHSSKSDSSRAVARIEFC